MEYIQRKNRITMKNPVKCKIVADNNMLFAILYFIYLIKDFVFYGTTINTLIGSSISKLVTLTLHVLVIILSSWLIFVKNRITKKRIMEFAILVIIAIMIAVQTGSTSFFDFILILFCMKCIDFNRALKTILIMQTLMSGIIIALAYLGITEMIIDTTNKSMGIRYAMGFTHPNRVGIISFEIICLILYCGKGKGGVKYIISVLISLTIYSIAKSRTALFLSMSIITAFYVYEVFGRRLNIHNVKRIAKFVITLMCIAIVIFIAYLYKNQKIYCESTLVSRIRMAIIYYDAYSVNFFGNKISSGTNTSLPGTALGYYYLDNAPLEYLLRNGIMAFAFFVGCYCLSISKLIKNKRWSSLIILLCYAIYGMVETNPFSIVCNVFLLIFGYIIQNKDEEIKSLK